MKTEKRKSLQGSVLFTVVCVMALLIIFLTGTLALASASSNRAHKSYSSSQANYTARATIESFIKAMERKPGIPAAIQNIDEDPLYASVVINDKTLGQVGCYQGGTWTPDVIEIAPVASEKEQYIFDDPKGDGDWKWVKVTTVKITAVCRVGKEEETVTAFVRKSPAGSSKTTPGGLNGLQEVGGNAFPNGARITGGLGVGISKDNTGIYTVHNNTQVETDITYVNGSLTAGTGSSQFNVMTPSAKYSSKKPISQTIIMGNLWLRNSNFMNVNYNIGSDYTQKEIPYLYIDGTMGSSNNGGVDVIKGDGISPFNIFIGTLDSRSDLNGSIPHNYHFGSADLYLMDEYDPDVEEYITLKYPGETDREFSAEEMTDETDPRGEDLKQYDKKVRKGKNYIGTSQGRNELYAWTQSYLNKSDTQFRSTGGNIYCNGDLVIENMEIGGDLRVMGDCTIGPNVSVGGSIVVYGELNVPENFDSWHKVYCDHINVEGETSSEVDVLQDGYTEHINELKPGYREVRNLVYENEPLTEDDYEMRQAFQSPDDGWRWHIRYPGDDEDGTRLEEENDGWGDGMTDGIPNQQYAIYVLKDSSAITEGKNWGSNPPCRMISAIGEPLDIITFNNVTIYKADPNNTESPYIDDTENYKIVDNEYSYYRLDDEGNVVEEVSADTAIGTYYTLEGDPNIHSRDEAYKRENVSSHRYEDFHQEAYPSSMTREAILGYYDENGEFKTDPATKIIKNLGEMRNDLNLNPNGTYKEDVYFTSVPEEFWEQDEIEGHTDAYNLPYAFNDDGSKNTGSAGEPNVWEGDTIVRSCVIGKRDGTQLEITKDIKIKSSNEMWVVLRNLKFNGGTRKISCNTESGKVRFLLDDLIYSYEGLVIHPQNFYDGCNVNPLSKWNIEYYGTEGSKIACRLNSTFVGTFMCPATTFNSTVAGAWGCYYEDAYGVVKGTGGALNAKDYSPIIGSAMFAHIDFVGEDGNQNMDNFGVLNSGGGGADSDTEVVETVFGTFEISYFMGV